MTLVTVLMDMQRRRDWTRLDRRETLPDTPIPVGLSGLIFLRCQPKVGADRTRFSKAGRIVDRGSIYQGDQCTDPGRAHQSVANLVGARDLQHLPVEPGELAPQCHPGQQHCTDHCLQSGVPCDQFLDPRLEPTAADFAELQPVAAKNSTDAELDVEQLSLQKLAPDEYGAGILRRHRFA